MGRQGGALKPGVLRVPSTRPQPAVPRANMFISGWAGGGDSSAPGHRPLLPGAISQAAPPSFTFVPVLQDSGTDTGHRDDKQEAALVRAPAQRIPIRRLSLIPSVHVLHFLTFFLHEKRAC